MSRKVDTEHVIESCRPIRLGGGCRKKNELCRGEVGLEASHYVASNSALKRPLFGEPQDILLQFCVSVTRLKRSNLGDLPFRQSHSSGSGFMVVPANVAVGHLRHFQVRQLAE